jgi:hypothetical protein
MTSTDSGREAVPRFSERSLCDTNTSGGRRPATANLAALLLIAAIVLGTYDAWQIVGLRNQGAFLRFQRLDSQAFDELYRQSGPSAEDLDFFAGKLEQAGLYGIDGDKQRIVFVLRWVMDHVNSAALDTSASATEAFQRAQEGQGLSCGSMTLIFAAAVRAAGYKARRVQLVRSVLNDIDTHITVEVLLNGRWVIFDPTFNTSYEKGGVLIGAQEVRQSLIDGRQELIKPLFYGEVVYPARLSAYYLNWLPLFNNLFILFPEHGWHLPPFRYWWGPQWNYLETTANGLWYFQQANRSYLLYAVLLPITSALLCLLSGLCYLMSRGTTFPKSNSGNFEQNGAEVRRRRA